MATSLIFGLKGIWTNRGKAMTDELLIARKKTLNELKSEALAGLERRGYEVRGKTTTEIRQILRRRPTKLESIASNSINGLKAREKVQF